MTYPDDAGDGYTEDENDEQQQPRTINLSRDQLKTLERDAKQSRKAVEEAAELRRELAFARAGMEFTETQRKALLSVVDGEVTSDAIKAAAADLGFGQASPPPDPAAGDIAALDRIGAAAAGSSSQPATEDAIALLQKADREGGRAGLLAELQRNGYTVFQD